MSIPYFDTHCDTASEIMGRCGLRSNQLHVDLERGGKYSPRGQVFAFFADKGNFSDYKAMYKNFTSELVKNSDLVSLCTSASEAEIAYSEGKTAAFLSVEGAELLDCSVEKLEEAYRDGVRIVTLTWNYQNALSGSNKEGCEFGLTGKGKEFVRACNRMGVLVDVSHLSDKGFWDVIDITDKPIIATHSNSRSICSHSRNLTDDMFKALIQTGGAVGINLYGEFLGENANIQTVLRHIEHFLELGGEKHLMIGADLDGCDILPAEISGVQDMYKLYDGIKRSFGIEASENIFFNNAKALFRL